MGNLPPLRTPQNSVVTATWQVQSSLAAVDEKNNAGCLTHMCVCVCVSFPTAEGSFDLFVGFFRVAMNFLTTPANLYSWQKLYSRTQNSSNHR